MPTDNTKYCCQRCGGTKHLQRHHTIAGDDSSTILLCAECHSKEHPNIPKQVFLWGGLPDERQWISKTERNKFLFKVHFSQPELSLEELGEIFGISRQRVHQLIKVEQKKRVAVSGSQ